MKPRVINTLNNLKAHRWNELINIFFPIAKRDKNIKILTRSIRNSIVIGISDGLDNGSNFRDWRFQTVIKNIKANYHEVWNNMGKDKYFLERSYLHLYSIENTMTESEYVLLHCDASEPDNTPHSLYKQSPHLHIEVSPQPLPKAHIALYNGRVAEVLKDLNSFNEALKECIEMINSQILI